MMAESARAEAGGRLALVVGSNRATRAEARALGWTLTTLGWSVAPILLGSPVSQRVLAGRIAATRADVALIRDDQATRLELATWRRLEAVGIPIVGGGAALAALGASAGLAGRARLLTMLRAAGLPTPSWLRPSPRAELVFDLDTSASSATAWLVRRASSEDPLADAGDPEPCRNLERAYEMVARWGGDWLIEEFIEGREFQIAWSPEASSERLWTVGELVHHQLQAHPDAWSQPGPWALRTQRARRFPGALEDRSSRWICPAVVEDDQARMLKRLTEAAARAVGCVDPALVTIRWDRSGHPRVVGVDLRPDLGPGSVWARLVRASGLSYRSALSRLLNRRRGANRHAA